MGGFLDDLEGLLKRERDRQASDDRQKATEERFDRIEGAIGKIGEAVGSLAQNPPGRSSSGGDGEGSGDGPPARAADSDPGAEEDEGGPELPLERVSKMDVPRIWSGDDEPSTVKYLDADDGSEKTRKGRKKGQPYGWNVEAVDDDAGEEGAAA